MTPAKIYRDEYESDDDEYNKIVLPHKDKCLMPTVAKLDMAAESHNDYFRSNCKGTKI